MLTGPECSILAFVDGKHIYVMEPAQDHKPVEDGDVGPMTGGMGAYSPYPGVDVDEILDTIVLPTLRTLTKMGIDYREELLFEPEYNIRVGGHYIGRLYQQYVGVLPRSIGAFNAGPGAMKK